VAQVATSGLAGYALHSTRVRSTSALHVVEMEIQVVGIQVVEIQVVQIQVRRGGLARDALQSTRARSGEGVGETTVLCVGKKKCPATGSEMRCNKT
jgi:hypothetical protein